MAFFVFGFFYLDKAILKSDHTSISSNFLGWNEATFWPFRAERISISICFR